MMLEHTKEINDNILNEILSSNFNKTYIKDNLDALIENCYHTLKNTLIDTIDAEKSVAEIDAFKLWEIVDKLSIMARVTTYINNINDD